MTGFLGTSTVATIGTELAAATTANVADAYGLIVIALAIPVTFVILRFAGSLIKSTWGRSR